MTDMVVVPKEPTEEMIWAGALAAMEAATEFMEDDFWKDRHLAAIETMKAGDYGSDDQRAKGLKVGALLYRAMIASAPPVGEGMREKVETALRALRSIPKPQVNDGVQCVYLTSDDVPEDIFTAISWLEAALSSGEA